MAPHLRCDFRELHYTGDDVQISGTGLMLVLANRQGPNQHLLY